MFPENKSSNPIANNAPPATDIIAANSVVIVCVIPPISCSSPPPPPPALIVGIDVSGVSPAPAPPFAPLDKTFNSSKGAKDFLASFPAFLVASATSFILSAAELAPIEIPLTFPLITSVAFAVPPVNNALIPKTIPLNNPTIIL